MSPTYDKPCARWIIGRDCDICSDATLRAANEAFDRYPLFREHP